MILSKRLKFIASFIKKDMVVADIGADHGLLSYYLLSENIVKKLYATDNKKGPFSNLQKTFKNSSFDVELALQDGLINLPDYVNTVIIAGMGGELINTILREGKSFLKNVDTLILSPHLDVPAVRKYLVENGFCITDEGVIYDEKFYTVIIAKKGFQSLQEKELILGPILIKNRNEVILKMWKERIDDYQQLLTIPNLEKLRKETLEKELKYYLEEMYEFKEID